MTGEAVMDGVDVEQEQGIGKHAWDKKRHKMATLAVVTGTVDQQSSRETEIHFTSAPQEGVHRVPQIDSPTIHYS